MALVFTVPSPTVLNRILQSLSYASLDISRNKSHMVFTHVIYCTTESRADAPSILGVGGQTALLSASNPLAAVCELSQ
jgi:hypothetical protein